MDPDAQGMVLEFNTHIFIGDIQVSHVKGPGKFVLQCVDFVLVITCD